MKKSSCRMLYDFFRTGLPFFCRTGSPASSSRGLDAHFLLRLTCMTVSFTVPTLSLIHILVRDLRFLGGDLRFLGGNLLLLDADAVLHIGDLALEHAEDVYKRQPYGRTGTTARKLTKSSLAVPFWNSGR